MAAASEQAGWQRRPVQSWHYDGYAVHQVGADWGGEAFLLQTDSGDTVLFDTGFAFCAPETLENIYAVTGGAPVDKIVLTHSHYDHCVATNYLVTHMPRAKVYASAHAARVFTRAGAFVTMSALNAERAASKGLSVYEDVPSEIVVDVVLDEGDCFHVGPLEFTTFSAVGHTRCCLAFWCESAGLFVSSETSGVVCMALPKGVDVPDDVAYMVDFPTLVSYQSARDHIERVRALPIRVFVATHYGCISGNEVDELWRAMDFWIAYAEDLIVGMYKQGYTEEEIISTYKDIFYWGGSAPYQPEAAFDLNVSHVVPTIIRDCCTEAKG